MSAAEVALASTHKMIMSISGLSVIEVAGYPLDTPLEPSQGTLKLWADARNENFRLDLSISGTPFSYQSDSGDFWRALSDADTYMYRMVTGAGDGGSIFVLKPTSESGQRDLQVLFSTVKKEGRRGGDGGGGGGGGGGAAGGPNGPGGTASGSGGSAGAAAGGGGGGSGAGGTHGRPAGAFDSRTDPASAEQYFGYYGSLCHQQNMLEDVVRTSTYHAAITENAADFRDAVVLDVGAGSGVLSLFAAAAGARLVLAVEASAAARWARVLAASNPALVSRIRVLQARVEDLRLRERVDVLVSEPMGTLLVNERMLETYIYARDRLLKPGGRMFPAAGRLHAAAFCDAPLHAEVRSKADFWLETDFFGISLAGLAAPAAGAHFSRPVIDTVPPEAVVSNASSLDLDLRSLPAEALATIVVPLSLQVRAPCLVHGIAAWFDVLFDGSQHPRWLSTAPGMPPTHWHQIRFLLDKPLVISRPGASVRGEMRLVSHARQSYDVFLTLRAPPAQRGAAEQHAFGRFDLKDPQYRQPAWAEDTTSAQGGAGHPDDAAYRHAAPPGGYGDPPEAAAAGREGAAASASRAAVAASLSAVLASRLHAGEAAVAQDARAGAGGPASLSPSPLPGAPAPPPAAAAAAAAAVPLQRTHGMRRHAPGDLPSPAAAGPPSQLPHGSPSNVPAQSSSANTVGSSGARATASGRSAEASGGAGTRPSTGGEGTMDWHRGGGEP